MLKSSVISHRRRQTKEKVRLMSSQKPLLEQPPRPPDPSLFIRAGTSGVRHLFPIHLTESICENAIDDDLFIRPISHVRSRTPTTDLCTTIEMIRNICLSIRTLEHIDISENELEYLPIDLALLIHLQTLNCSHNRLTTISDVFEQLNQLKDLNLSFNHFKRLPNVICSFQELIRLNCEHNSMKNLDGNLINLKLLKYLVLDHNQFQSFHHFDFSQLQHLEYLHIAHNQLTKFPNTLSKLTHLKNLNLSHNHLTSFPTELLLINTLDVLNLSHNNITKLAPLTDAYRRTTTLFSIDLSFNQLTKFYDYLILISLKVDLSNNQIQIISFDSIRKFDYYLIHHRELKLYHNPIVQPKISMEILNNQIPETINFLHVISNSFEEQHADQTIRQGFKISITGPKNSGKSSLAYCLEEEDMPLIPEENHDRMVNVFQFPFRFGLPSKIPKKPTSKQSNTDKGKKSRLQSNLLLPSAPIEPIKTLPLTIFDFNGNEQYYEQFSPFLDTHALHLVCVHTIEFHQSTPKNVEDIFRETFDRSMYPMIEQLLQILQLLCEKVTDKNRLMILPVATHMDLIDQRSTIDKTQVLEKINEFFQCYLRSRLERIQFEMKQIDSLPMITSSLSDRLKTYNSLLHLHIQIEPCQSISSLSYQGIDELHRTIEQHILTQKLIFPHIDRILPILWADTNRDIESLADRLPVPYLLWDDFTTYIIEHHGLKNLIQDISMSLEDQGKIVIVNEIGTNNRLVFLRPLWLGDLLSCLFHPTFDHQFGHVHIDRIRSLWKNFFSSNDLIEQFCFLLMRFLLIAYPKMRKKQLKNLLQHDMNNEMKFEEIIFPYYLPWLDPDERQEETKMFFRDVPHSVNITYRSSRLPRGFFHRYSVSAIFKLDIVYHKHWNNILLGEHDSKKVRFLIETDHQSYLNCICGTNILEQPFDQIWSVLMSLINQFEEMFRLLAPNCQFHRLIQCPVCHEYSFLGEWMTPKELQGMKWKICTLCGENVDTNYLIQPNENKRRNEELLKKIRERKARQASDQLIEKSSAIVDEEHAM